MDQQEQFDEAMFEFSRGELDLAIAKLRHLLGEHPDHFDAQLSLGMAYFRKGEYHAAIAEGHKAERMNPKEQLVHTNLSLFYQKVGDKPKAEHHGLQARIASWRENPNTPPPHEKELEMAKPPTPAPPAMPDMPWKKKRSITTPPAGSAEPSSTPTTPTEPGRQPG